ncbi:hypothetical protein BDW74DRAFT_177288 [Aspergillus multicolor]|uniref:uncharacterized protein n=1 Tax=Aspergillus multicolor TaxID=41759 RepID=UPI003CCCF27F
MDSDSDTVDGQYCPTLQSPLSPISGYPPSQGVEPPRRIPRSTRFADPDDFLRQFYNDLAEQMDDWIEKLDNIQESVRSKKLLHEAPALQPFADADGAIPKPLLPDDLNAEQPPVSGAGLYGSHYAFATDHNLGGDWGRDRGHYGQNSIAHLMDHETDHVYTVPTGEDDDVDYVKLNAAIDEDWSKLLQIKSHISGVKDSLAKLGNLHWFLPDRVPSPV